MFNLQINIPNNSQVQTELKVDLLKAIAQSSPVPSTSHKASPTPSTDENFSSAPFFQGSQEWIVGALLILLLFYPMFTIWYLLGRKDIYLKEFEKILGSSMTEDQKMNIITAQKKYVEAMLPKIVEAITVILIVLIVALLSLTNKVSGQAAISILSALIGYVLGKQVTNVNKN